MRRMFSLAAIIAAMSCCGKGNNSEPVPARNYNPDTLRVMAYNVLNYGDGCQGNMDSLNAYFRTIIRYTQPDILSCEKMYAPGHPAETIASQVLNVAFPQCYDYAKPTNTTNGDDVSVLFYNKQKLGYVYTETLVSNITDFDLYKLYYKDSTLAQTHDSLFLYVVVNHTKSGSNSATRDQQVTAEMQALRRQFKVLPNVINMGDFNTHSSMEDGYQTIVSGDSTTAMYDPPFFPDGNAHYPVNWDVNPALVAPYLTTSTRLLATVPNSCGTSGGAKSWFDHIFISRPLLSGSNHMQYVKGSYQAVGNDGNRINADLNDHNSIAPQAVLDALFQFSNKYPVMIRVAIH
ncbi:exonuclease/endonuclease/phosphatase family protein [Chitinophaga vietnamensis]|uniref:hypothetical protein n=1 Tax=Chitinophaga vietnamensis TaxID=2593957 RepID=UPI00117863BE|nr:hypothetical protein [Chitinophaga vietnamensis]